MKDLLYVGNKLSKHGTTATAIEVLGPFLEQEGFRLAYASSKKKRLARLADMLWQTFLRRRKTDYVLIDTYSTWNFWYAFAVSQLCRVLGLKYIPILHGGNLPKRLSGNPRLCRMIFGHSRINVAPSGYLFEVFSNAGYRVEKIPNPFDSADFRYIERQAIAPDMIWVRSFAALYNPGMALDVLQLVRQKYPEAKLCMVGPDKDGLRAILEQRAKAENLNVTFTGRLPKKEWAALASDYDVFINTSHVDNAPFSVVEALSLGLAVISTNVGGIPHLLEHRKTAMLVEDNDARAMAAAVCELVENGALRNTLIAHARVLVGQSEWQNCRKKWLEILV